MSLPEVAFHTADAVFHVFLAFSVAMPAAFFRVNARFLDRDGGTRHCGAVNPKQNARRIAVLAATLMAAGAGCDRKPPATTPTAAPLPSTNKVSSVETNQLPLASAAEFNAWLTNETDAVKLSNAGTELIERGALREAVACLRRAAELKPGDEEAHFNLGYAYARGGAVEPAIMEYRKALELFPEYAEAHNNLGNLLLRQKRHDEAITEFSAALQANAEFGSAHNNLGRALAELGRAKEAVPHFLSAARLDPQNIEAQFNLGTAYQAMGRTNDAIARHNEALRLRPGFSPAMQALARLRDGR